MIQKPEQDPKSSQEERKPYETPKVRSYGNIQQITNAKDGLKVDSPSWHKTGL